MPEANPSTQYLREPLFHFVVLAVFLFGMDYLFSATQKEQILVDRQAAEFLIQQREDLELRDLSPEEKEDVINTYVADEILYSEAYKRGLDRGDSRMRRNMILKMRGLLTGDIDEPTEPNLRSYFEANQEQFTVPASIAFDHVYFSNPDEVKASILDQLRGGTDHKLLGEQIFNMPPTMSSMTRQFLVGAFGPDAAKSILAITDDNWHGPIESNYGIHFVRITARTPQRIEQYEEVAPFLAQYWVLNEGRRKIEAEIERIRDSYDVVIEPYD